MALWNLNRITSPILCAVWSGTIVWPRDVGTGRHIMHENRCRSNCIRMVVSNGEVGDREAGIETLRDALTPVRSAVVSEDDVACSQFVGVDPAATQGKAFAFVGFQFSWLRTFFQVSAFDDPRRGGTPSSGSGIRPGRQ
jgi:hypothetical protein